MPDQPFIDWEPVGAPEPRRTPRRRRPRSNRTTAIGASLLVAGLVSSFAVAAPGGGSDQPVRASGNRPGPMLRIINEGTGRSGLLQCTGGKGDGCLYVRNTGDGPAARFAAKAGVAPFRVPFRSGKVPGLNADSVDGLGARDIIDEALERSAGGREPAGSAGGDLAGNYPNPTLAAGSIDTLNLFADDLRNGDALRATLRSLGTGAQQAAAGDDPRLSDSRVPTGAAGGDLGGTYPNPTIAKDGAPGTPTLRSLGTGAQQAAPGNDPRFSDTRAPSGPAGGDLGGTYPNPTIAKDGAAGTPTLRSLGTSATQAAAGNDARFSDSRAPTGAAGGDLTGTFPNPTLGAGSIDAVSLFSAGLQDGAAGTTTLRSLGTGAQQAAAGNDARLSNPRTPTGTAGGDLTGTYPNPTLGTGSIDATGLFTAGLQDGAAGTTTLRSLGTGAQQAAAGNDARFSDSRTPTGAAGGDLTGTYPNPTLGASSVASAEVADNSLRITDTAVYTSTASVQQTSIPGNSCQTAFADVGFDVLFGDVLVVDGDESTFPGQVQTFGHVQNDANQLNFTICNLAGNTETYSGFVRLSLYRP